MGKRFAKLDASGVPVAHHIQVCFCDNPDCGPHIVLFNRNDEPIAQAPLTIEQGREVAEYLHNVLYAKAASRDR